MRHTILIIMLFSVLLASAAVARDVPTATRIDEAQLQQLNLMRALGQEVGNLNPAYYGLSGWFWGDESYAYIFTADNLICDPGFMLETVHFLASFEETMVPVTFDMSVSLNEGVDLGGGCFGPGDVLCSSFVYSITIDTAGLYDLALPIDCACAFINDPVGNPYVYALEAHFFGLFDMDVVVDAMPSACTAYNDWSEGWYDLFGSFSGYGNIVMWGDVVCCANPVANEETTWGAIKSMYK